MFKLLTKFRNLVNERRNSRKLSNWYKISFDEQFIFRHVSPPKREAWSDQFAWSDIERICFECTDYMYPDNIYFYVKNRPESYLIPSEANGGHELWAEVLDRMLFDAELAAQAMTSISGTFCYPSETDNSV